MVVFSLSSVFSLLMWQQSSGAGLNIFDVLISLPSLLILAPLMIHKRWIGAGFLFAATPLVLYLLYAILSLSWASMPDYSRTFRAAGQVLAIFTLFSYLQLAGKTHLLKKPFWLPVYPLLSCLHGT